MASSDVVLSAALRNNLLSLQGTQRLIDTVQLRLATGLKVNSALDGPQQFFTSQSLCPTAPATLVVCSMVSTSRSARSKKLIRALQL
jgi:hypothetical protein